MFATATYQKVDIKVGYTTYAMTTDESGKSVCDRAKPLRNVPVLVQRLTSL